MLLLPLLLLQGTLPMPGAAAQEPDASATEVVVTARRRKAKCSVAIADRVISDGEFRARAAEWAAGTPVRVVAPTSSDYQCLARIAFKLGDYGVKRIIFERPR